MAGTAQAADVLLAALLEEVVEELRARWGPVGACLLKALDHVVAAGRAKDTAYVLREEQGAAGRCWRSGACSCGSSWSGSASRTSR